MSNTTNRFFECQMCGDVLDMAYPEEARENVNGTHGYVVRSPDSQGSVCEGKLLPCKDPDPKGSSLPRTGYPGARPVKNENTGEYNTFDESGLFMREWVQMMAHQGWTHYAMDGWASGPRQWVSVQELLKSLE